MQSIEIAKTVKEQMGDGPTAASTISALLLLKQLQLGNAAAGGATSSGSRPALGATNPLFEPCHLAFIESCFKEMVTTVIKEKRQDFWASGQQIVPSTWLEARKKGVDEEGNCAVNPLVFSLEQLALVGSKIRSLLRSKSGNVLSKEGNDSCQAEYEQMQAELAAWQQRNPGKSLSSVQLAQPVRDQDQARGEDSSSGTEGGSEEDE
eukprot:CAMPEP_0202353952 /NCGR_PEP_ID=MMETSP1126-20121109/9486_1 /ASSEMBLY_ACC=CAM_ASM_000457 /TAXON_ID=3047 /ORGANISM="Dunaliella tertiolecta, Strain CCMP1320" /LENGTH=206 /DNA_ID=CAMNT_0048946361 /DNA_START=71 /DNA_END=693 /DNA_ORIENTATION=+